MRYFCGIKNKKYMAREIFISYSRSNLDTVTSIKSVIERKTGEKCWMDLNAIESGSPQFTQNIVDGINTCSVFLFMLSKESQTSEFALKELNFAMKKAKKDEQRHVVIVNIDGCEMCDEFDFMYGLTDTIAWKDKPQKEKLLKDMTRWLEDKRKAEEELKCKAEEEHQRKLKVLENVILHTITKDGKYGFADMSGKVVIPYQWEFADSFSEGTAAVKDPNGKYGFIDKTGLVVIPCQWKKAWGFSEGLAAVEDIDEKWGYINKIGEVVIPCRWKFALPFFEGLADVQNEDGKHGFIDKTDKVVIPCRWKNVNRFSENLAPVQNANGNWGYINKAGNVVIPCQWKNVWPFTEGLAAVEDANGKWGYIDKTGEVVIPCQWKEAMWFREGWASVKDANGKWGRIDKTGKVVGGG